jgi:hypothetical protein
VLTKLFTNTSLSDANTLLTLPRTSTERGHMRFATTRHLPTSKRLPKRAMAAAVAVTASGARSSGEVFGACFMIACFLVMAMFG